MHRVVWGGAASILALMSAAPCQSADPSPTAQAFGARPSIEQVTISPDGQSIAMIQPLKDPQAAALLVAKLDGSAQPKPVLVAGGKPERLDGCGWVSNARLVCGIFMVLDKDGKRLGYSRMLAVNADGSKVQELSSRSAGTEAGYRQNGGDVVDWLADDATGSILMSRQFVAEETAGTLISNSKTGLGVDRVNTNTLARSAIESPRANAIDFISDQHGAVRIVGDIAKTGAGYLKGQISYAYRAVGSNAWTPLSTYDDETRSGFIPVAVDRDQNAAYGFEWIDGHKAVVRIALDGSKKRDVLAARDDVDVDELVRVGRQNRIVGASYATDERHVIFFDPAMDALSKALTKALPGQPAIGIVGASLDESKLILRASSDVDPGHYYLYDKKTRGLAEVGAVRPELDKVKLAAVKPVSYKADDGTMVPGYLTLPPGSDGKNLPAIVMPHGGPEARDEWGFDWLAQYFAHQGYAVLQPNFRGSSGYGEAWFEKNGFQSWKRAVGDINDAGRWLRDQGIAAPDKLAIVGWSYGGYAALQSAVLDPDLFKAIVAIAPVTDLDTYREESRGFTNFALVDSYVGKGPHISEGSPAQNADRIKAPVLLFHGDLDRNVSINESRLMQAKLKRASAKVDLVEFKGLDHQLEDSQVRAQMLQQADDFLRASMRLK